MKLYYVRSYSHKQNLKSRWLVTANSEASAAWRVGTYLSDDFKVEHIQRVCDLPEGSDGVFEEVQ